MVDLLGSKGVQRVAMKRRAFSFMFRHLNTMIQTFLDVFNLQCGVDEQQFHRLNPASQPSSYGGI